ncbi:Tubby-like protein 4 [Ranunculus cassubicifolius]
MSGLRKSSVLRQSSLYQNPLKHVSDGDLPKRTTLAHQLFGDQNSVSNSNKENVTPSTKDSIAARNKGNVLVGDQNSVKKSSPSSRVLLKSSSLQQCMQFNETDSTFENSSQANNLWDHSDSEAAPAASWSTLPNRYLLCRPLPIDIGRCTCVIVKEVSLDAGSFYALYTNEGHGRQDRKLAVACHRRRNGRSEYTVAQSAKGLSTSSDESILGTMTSNFMGSKYHIWDQGTIDPLKKQPKLLLAVVGFVPTVITCTGSYRSLRAWIPKHQSMQLKSTSKIQHISGLPKDWEEKTNRSQQLFSMVPHYNNFSSQYELDFRQRGRAGLRIQSSVKNFQLTMEVCSFVVYMGDVGNIHASGKRLVLLF